MIESDETKYIYTDSSSSGSSWQTISSYKTLKSQNIPLEGLHSDTSLKDSENSDTTTVDSENTTLYTAISSSNSTYQHHLVKNVTEVKNNQDNDKTNETAKTGKNEICESEKNSFTNDNTTNNRLNLNTKETQSNTLYSEISNISSISSAKCLSENSFSVDRERTESYLSTKLMHLPLIKQLTTPMIGAGVKSEEFVSSSYCFLL